MGMMMSILGGVHELILVGKRQVEISLWTVIKYQLVNPLKVNILT